MPKIPVTVYTKSNCVQCDQTKKQFDKHGVEYNVVNLEENLEKLEEFKERGLMSAPIVTTDVKEWSGFRLDKIEGLARHIKSMERNG
jgi:glutaredoxin-like protein NrdH